MADKRADSDKYCKTDHLSSDYLAANHDFTFKFSEGLPRASNECYVQPEESTSTVVTEEAHSGNASYSEFETARDKYFGGLEHYSYLTESQGWPCTEDIVTSLKVPDARSKWQL